MARLDFELADVEDELRHTTRDLFETAASDVVSGNSWGEVLQLNSTQNSFNDDTRLLRNELTEQAVPLRESQRVFTNLIDSWKTGHG